MSLDTLKRTNSLDKLLGAVQQENAPQEKKSYNFLLIRPGEKKGNYILIIKDNNEDFNLSIMG